VTGGDHEGRKVWTMFNIQNKSEAASKIGRDQLKSFLSKSTYTGDVNKLETVTDLIGLEAFASVTVRRDETWGDKNEIKYWKDSMEGTPLATGFAQDHEASFP